MRDILGGKGAGLAEMANLGLPVPPGFTISAKLCLSYLEQGTFPEQLREEVGRRLKQLEQTTKKRFGDPTKPLLVSVRSGAAVSMPGMMETILNLGLNDDTVEGLIRESRNPGFAYDSYRRFVQMYGDVVFDLGREPFEEVLAEFRQRRTVTRDIDLPAEDLKALVQEFRSEEHTSELQSRSDLVCRLLLEKKKNSRIITVFDYIISRYTVREFIAHAPELDRFVPQLTASFSRRVQRALHRRLETEPA